MPPPGDRDALNQRWKLIRDLSAFVVKAAIETVRDLVLIPVASLAGLLGLLFEKSDPRRYFREVMEVGRRFDVWLNLFGSAEEDARAGLVARASRAVTRRGAEPAGVDALIARVERALLEQHRRGGVTAQAKEAIDRTLDAIQRVPDRHRDDPDGGR
jgi:hypothetical protein